nr:MAG TPA: hypothetical protein [Crassvirales sp.]
MITQYPSEDIDISPTSALLPSLQFALSPKVVSSIASALYHSVTTVLSYKT